MAEADPYTKLHDRLTSMVRTSKAFNAVVKEKNFISFDDEKKQPIRSNVQIGNLPEVMLLCQGNIDGNLSATTTSSKFIRQYQFLVSTGDLRYKKILAPIEFAIVAAMSQWPQFESLTWREVPFVKALRFVNSTVGISDSKLNRGIEGWSAVVTISVELYLKISDLQGIN